MVAHQTPEPHVDQLAQRVVPARPIHDHLALVPARVEHMEVTTICIDGVLVFEDPIMQREWRFERERHVERDRRARRFGGRALPGAALLAC